MHEENTSIPTTELDLLCYGGKSNRCSSYSKVNEHTRRCQPEEQLSRGSNESTDALQLSCQQMTTEHS